MTDKDAQKLYKELAAFSKSRAWAYMREIMEKEIVIAAKGMGGNPTMTIEEIHFRRGSIWTAEQLLEMPEKLLSRLETDLVLQAATSPAKAGQGE